MFAMYDTIYLWEIVTHRTHRREIQNMKWTYADGGRSKYFKAGNVRDCCVRAVANATGIDYKEVYLKSALRHIRAGETMSPDFWSM